MSKKKTASKPKIECWSGGCGLGRDICCYDCADKYHCSFACDNYRCRKGKLRDGDEGKKSKVKVVITSLVLMAMVVTGAKVLSGESEYELALRGAQATEKYKVEYAEAREQAELQEAIENEDYEVVVVDDATTTIEDMIIEACEEHGIDSTIPVAISRLETGHWTSNACINYNNVGGLSIDEVPMQFDSLEEGVDVFVSNLAENYFAEGITDIDDIAEKYCPLNKDHWAAQVKQLAGE